MSALTDDRRLPLPDHTNRHHLPSGNPPRKRHNEGMTGATITPPRCGATSTTMDRPARHPAEELAEHLEHGRTLLDQARLIGDIGDFQCWRAAREPWIEVAAESLGRLCGPEEADDFRHAVSPSDGGERWQDEHTNESKRMKAAIDVLISLQRQPEPEEEPNEPDEPEELAPGPQDAPRRPSVRAVLAPEPQAAAPVPTVGVIEPEPQAPAPMHSVGVIAQQPAGSSEIVQSADGAALLGLVASDPEQARTRQVFLHGGDEEWRLAVAGLLERAGSNGDRALDGPVDDRGESVSQAQVQAAGLRYAVILLTADDVGAPRLDSDQEPYYSPRPRQSVVFELGVLAAALGPHRVCALYEDGVERPCEVNGLSYIRLDLAGAWQTQLLLKLRSAGFDYDVNTIQTDSVDRALRRTPVAHARDSLQGRVWTSPTRPTRGCDVATDWRSRRSASRHLRSVGEGMPKVA